VADSEDREEPSAADADDNGKTREERDAEREARERSFRRLGDSLIGSIWGDSSAAFKRGQGLVTGVAQGTKEELVRIFSHEVRGFLDKMDAADLMQEIVSGLVIEMKTEIRFRRDDDGKLESNIETTETKVSHEQERKAKPKEPEAKPKKADKPGED
jgi:hypothetical protein